MGLTYRESGVDIDKGDRFVEIIREKLNRREQRNIGLFGGLFDLSLLDYKNPVLVSSTDGVGTKLLLAKEANNYSTIGIDLVAMCVNDIICIGANPLFFLDYMATSELELGGASEVIDGIIEGCRLSGCMLLGGETAEMPGVYRKGDYELAGFACGIVEKDEIIDPRDIKKGDLLIGVRSSGIHSNGLSLARRALFEKKGYDFHFKHKLLDHPLIIELLIPTRIYVDTVLEIVKYVRVKGIAHITGGGIYNNVKRLLPEGLDANLFWTNIKSHPIFTIIQEAGNIEDDEMRKTFNMGVGLVFVVSIYMKEKVFEFLKEKGEEPVFVGEVI